MTGKKIQQTKLAARKGQRPALPFDRKKESILFKRVKQKHAFEEIKKIKDKNKELGDIWDEELCE